MAREAFITHADATCPMLDTLCANDECSGTISRDHIHLMPISFDDVEPPFTPFGACSEECAMAVVEVYGLEIVEAPDA